MDKQRAELPDVPSSLSPAEAMIVKTREVLRGRRGDRNIWHAPVGEVFLWLLPPLLAFFGHMYGFTKADMTGQGPGVHIALMNERTRWAQDVWYFLAGHPYLFGCYGVLLLGACLALKRMRVRWYLRAAALGVLALPGLWYFDLACYLGGKVLSL